MNSVLPSADKRRKSRPPNRGPITVRQVRFEYAFMVWPLEKQTDLLTPDGVRETGGSRSSSERR